eukprot:NODE_7008_length_423_cov_86.655080_g5388_i0.p4 GENE.NODE_7008_length_423_cov_86.655080_g5388_i0~~NODE_7008_length_423_cov_86.655080_g5388_i0.p4  ORF type:complete len:52 (-),score=28.99 NODE_7008_length_423_cov_86.655080_g5388_i0:266-400(-)
MGSQSPTAALSPSSPRIVPTMVRKPRGRMAVTLPPSGGLRAQGV